MAVEGEKALIDELNKFADMMRDLRQLTANLLSVCSFEQPASQDLADLLCRRQQLIAAVTAIELTAVSQMEGEEDQASEKKLAEIRRLLEETGDLERKAKTVLEGKRDRLKLELAGLRAGRVAGKAYTARAPQEEGFFLDSRKN